MVIFFNTFLISFIISISLIYFLKGKEFGIDTTSGVQKIHNNNAIRLGSISIFSSVTIVYFFLNDANILMKTTLFCLFPAMLAGLIEDVTHKFPIKFRLLGLSITSILLIYFTNSYVLSIEFKLFDKFFLLHLFQWLLHFWD